VGNEVREVGRGRLVGGENFGAKKGLKNPLSRGRGCVFGSSPKMFKCLHPELVAVGSF